MQLYALDKLAPLLSIHAEKHKNYCCPECLRVVRVRGGPRRQSHFYHLQATPSCRQHGKSLSHMMVQLHLKEIIPSLLLEKPFPQLGRIADLCWEEKKIVFEVQCSPMSYEEAVHRSSDYEKMGYTIIWLLHESRFNKKVLSAAESYFRQKNCYFIRGISHIYDQFEICSSFRRLFRGPPLTVDLTSPFMPPCFDVEEIPRRSLAFRGDLLDCFMKHQDLSHLRALKRHFTQKNRGFFLRAVYRRILDLGIYMFSSR